MINDFLYENIICPVCHNACEWSEDKIICQECNKTYPIKKNIPNFLQTERYWANLPREKMTEILTHMEEKGFQKGLQDHVPQYLHSAILHPGRADAKFFLPISQDSIVLDIGSMWGSLTFALAKNSKYVVGIDQTLETMQLGNYRLQEEKIDNVAFIGSTGHTIPFRNDVFDVVILNGVLEWLGYQDQYVVEEKWGKASGRKNISSDNTLSPRSLQLQALQEVLRILKPGGTVYIAIENRIRSAYFMGVPDDHSGLPFNSLLPRKLADLYSSIRLKQPYQAYTYTRQGLQSLVAEAGFVKQNFYTAFPSYGIPATIVPLKSKFLNFYLKNYGFQTLGNRTKSMHFLLYPLGLSEYIVPNFLVAAQKDGGHGLKENKNFSHNLLDKWSQIFPKIHKPDAIHLMKIKSRMESGAPISFLVFSDQEKAKLLGYIKTHRDEFGVGTVRHEAETYQHIYNSCDSCRVNLAKPFFAGQLNETTYILSREAVKGQPLTRYDLRQRTASSHNKTFRKLIAQGLHNLSSYYSSRPLRTVSFNDFAQRSIDWLIQFNDETRGREISFDEFWFHFFVERVEALAPKLSLSKDALLRYQDILKTLIEQHNLYMGPIHADYNFYNILISDKEIYIVDWEYAERESLPFFDALNFFTEIAIGDNIESLLALLNREYLGDDELILTGNRLLAKYAESQCLSLDFIKACSPIFVLDLLCRDYGFYGEGLDDTAFPLCSPNTFVKLFEHVQKEWGNPI